MIGDSKQRQHNAAQPIDLRLRSAIALFASSAAFAKRAGILGKAKYERGIQRKQNRRAESGHREVLFYLQAGALSTADFNPKDKQRKCQPGRFEKIAGCAGSMLQGEAKKYQAVWKNYALE
jgi:hypothetical protein